MADQRVARATEISRPRSNEAHQQIGIDVEKNTGWPQPTARERSGAAQRCLEKLLLFNSEKPIGQH